MGDTSGAEGRPSVTARVIRALPGGLGGLDSATELDRLSGYRVTLYPPALEANVSFYRATPTGRTVSAAGRQAAPAATIGHPAEQVN